ncbi:MAG: hypothetical protein AABX65_02255 [Nanoarchaeota archaeon]
MEKKFENYVISLARAEKALRVGEHIKHVTFPLLKDTKLLLKILTESYLSIMHAINAILQYEYAMKRTSITSNARDNLIIFRNKCAGRYGISEKELGELRELIFLAEMHKKSPLEFTKHGKIVIMSDSSQVYTIDYENMADFLELAKGMYEKAKEGIKRL